MDMILKENKAATPTAETYHNNSQDIKEVEELANELKRLLVSHEDTLDEEGIRKEVEVLERWMESYRRGLSAARKISETGTSLLEDLRNHLKLAIHERHRLEDEGGSTPTKAESDKIDDLTSAMRRIETMLPNIEHVFHAMAPEHEEA